MTPSETLWLWVVRVAGLGIAVHEVLRDGEERPSLLVLAGGMVMFKTVYDGARNVLGNGQQGQGAADPAQGEPPQ